MGVNGVVGPVQSEESSCVAVIYGGPRKKCDLGGSPTKVQSSNGILHWWVDPLACEGMLPQTETHLQGAQIQCRVSTGVLASQPKPQHDREGTHSSLASQPLGLFQTLWGLMRLQISLFHL